MNGVNNYQVVRPVWQVHTFLLIKSRVFGKINSKQKSLFMQHVCKLLNCNNEKKKKKLNKKWLTALSILISWNFIYLFSIIKNDSTAIEFELFMNPAVNDISETSIIQYRCEVDPIKLEKQEYKPKCKFFDHTDTTGLCVSVSVNSKRKQNFHQSQTFLYTVHSTTLHSINFCSSQLLNS